MNVFEQSAELNEWRLAELMDRAMTHHYRHGHTMRLDGWDCTKRSRYEVHLDASLIYIDKVTIIDFHPRGCFDCHRCHKATQMSSAEYAYFDYNQEAMICTKCNDKVKHTMVPAYPRMVARVFGDVELDSYEHVRMIDHAANYRRAAIQRTITLKRAARIVEQNPGFIFIDGKSAQEIRQDFLARRVLRKMREHVARQLREKVAYVIAKMTNINAETARGIAASSVV